MYYLEQMIAARDTAGSMLRSIISTVFFIMVIQQVC